MCVCVLGEGRSVGMGKGGRKVSCQVMSVHDIMAVLRPI